MNASIEQSHYQFQENISVMLLYNFKSTFLTRYLIKLPGNLSAVI